jgi:TPR repeat protein
MRAALCCLLLSVAAGAQADALSDANRLLAEKSYPEARRAFEQLANAGSAEASLRLGEMLWYGEGGQPDRAAADAIFARVAATGNQDARRDLALSSRRAARNAEIAYWVGQYDGADLASAEKACAMPAVPALSRTKAEAREAARQYAAWAECQSAFTASLTGARAAGKRIPGNLVELMSSDEARQASERLNGAYDKVIREARSDMAAVANRYLAWEKASRDYLAETGTLLAFEQEQWAREVNFDMRRAWETRMGSRDATTTLSAPPPMASRK